MDKIIGRMPVLEALKANVNVERVFIQDSVSGDFEIEVRNWCKERDVPLNRVPKKRLDREVKGNHQGIYALASLIQYVELEPLLQSLTEKSHKALLLMLDGIKDVRNLGAIARSAEVFGADAIIIPSKGSAAINEQTIKASAGALVHLPVCRVQNFQDALNLLGKFRVTVLGADGQADEKITNMDFSGPVAVVLGEEDRGISRHLKIYFDDRFYIPQQGNTESLNVSVAAGIILYEVYRQRQNA